VIPVVGVRSAIRRGRVLVIDDDAMVGGAIRRIIVGEHDVTVLTDARLALDRLFIGEQFDVILCDVMMPLISGVEFYQLLSQRLPEQVHRIIFVTGAYTAVCAPVTHLRHRRRVHRKRANIPRQRTQRPHQEAVRGPEPAVARERSNSLGYAPQRSDR
jgi:hypothetical protein